MIYMWLLILLLFQIASVLLNVNSSVDGNSITVNITNPLTSTRPYFLYGFKFKTDGTVTGESMYENNIGNQDGSCQIESDLEKNEIKMTWYFDV